MNLTVAYSPCPNDTFIFYALVHGLVDTEGLEFTPFIADVEELNRRAFEGEMDITKLSYHAWAHMADRYRVLDAGSALGFGNGPLLVSKHKIYPDEVGDLHIAIPGKYTTANLLLDLFWSPVKQKTSYLFSDIEEVVLSGECDAGLLIHENRFTYAQRGLKLIADLGEKYEEQYALPIPLGGIMVNVKLEDELQQRINRVMSRSVAFALDHPKEPMDYVARYTAEMDQDVMRKHIHLYVNEYTRSLKDEGREAIRHLLEEARKKMLTDPLPDCIFAD